MKQAIYKAARGMYNSLPVLISAILLVGLANAVVPKSFYSYFFSRNLIIDSFIGSALGSILAGNPITSYVIGGELLKQGISLVAVTAFIVSWVTVGIVQFPAEAILLGKKFAFYRNLSAFFLAIVVAILTVFVVSFI
ncbi:MAG: permease [Nanoarchaeota archaeon]|nr:permease [Nanoarchaeota archaeon]